MEAGEALGREARWYRGRLRRVWESEAAVMCRQPGAAGSPDWAVLALGALQWAYMQNDVVGA